MNSATKKHKRGVKEARKKTAEKVRSGKTSYKAR